MISWDSNPLNRQSVPRPVYKSACESPPVNEEDQEIRRTNGAIPVEVDGAAFTRPQLASRACKRVENADGVLMGIRPPPANPTSLHSAIPGWADYRTHTASFRRRMRRRTGKVR